MKPDTQAANVVTAEMVDAAVNAWYEGVPMRALLIASGLPAEVERLRERLRKTAQMLIEEVGADGPMDAEQAAQRVRAELTRLRGENERFMSENIMVHSWRSRCELAEAELKEARSEIAELSERLHRTVAVANERDALRGELSELRRAAMNTLIENIELADGDVCTLQELKVAVGGQAAIDAALRDGKELFAYCTEYPEEGAISLGRFDPDKDQQP